MENTDSNKKSFICIKCGNSEYISDKIATVMKSVRRSILTQIFHHNRNKFITVSCLKCGYTELYKTAIY